MSVACGRTRGSVVAWTCRTSSRSLGLSLFPSVRPSHVEGQKGISMGDRDTASTSGDDRELAIARLTKRVADRRAAEQLSKGAQAAERASAGLGTSDEDEFGL